MEQALFDTLLAQAKVHPEYAVSNEKFLLYPTFDMVTKESFVGIAFAATVAPKAEPNDTHNVVLCYSRNGLFAKRSDPSFTVWCGSKFLEGQEFPRQMRERVNNAAQSGTSGALHQQPSVALVRSELARTLGSHYNSYPARDSAAPCDFWSHWRRHQQVCSHVSHVLAYLQDQHPDFRQAMQQRFSEVRASLGEN